MSSFKKTSKLISLGSSQSPYSVSIDMTDTQNGGFAFVWEDTNGADSNVYLDVLNGNGKFLSKARLIGTAAQDDTKRPAVAVLSNGNIVVSYQDNTEVLQADVRVEYLNATGRQTQSTLTISGNTDASDNASELLALSDGGFAIAYDSFGRNSLHEVIYRTVSAKGRIETDELQVNQTTDSSQKQGQLVELSGGRTLVTWESRNVDGSFYGVMARIYSNKGLPETGEFRVNTYSYDSQADPVVAVLSDGRLAIAWRSDGQDGDEGGIFVRLLNDDGSFASAEISVNTLTQHNQAVPAIAATADGGFVVVWQSAVGNDPIVHTYARRFDADGAPIEGQKQISTNNNTFDGAPVATGLSDGGIAIAWAHLNDSQNGFDFVGRTFDAALYGTQTKDRLRDTVGANNLFGRDGHDKLFGLSGKDRIEGGKGDDALFGGQSRDVLFGQNGSDRMFGGAGGDRLIGGAGKDTLSGDAGADRLTGGNGADVFVFRDAFGSDTVTDFKSGQDKLRLDADMWGGGLKKAQVLKQFGTEADEGFQFSFDDGETLLLQGLTEADISVKDLAIV